MSSTVDGVLLKFLLKMSKEGQHAFAMAMQDEIRGQRIKEAENAGRNEESTDTV